MKTSFKSFAKSQFTRCKTSDDYLRLKRLLRGYGIQDFYLEMVEQRIFKNRMITLYSNPFARMIVDPKYRSDEYIRMRDFILISSKHDPNHKLLTPKLLSWNTFNVLTLDSTHLPLLKKMERVAEIWATIHRYQKPLFCFHPYPFNSVSALHLHILDLVEEPRFGKKRYNLPIREVIEALESENYLMCY